MIRDNELNEVKKLIQNGFDLELISFELDIPLKEIKQIKQEIDEQTNTRKYNHNEKANIRNKKEQTKMQQMRERYKKLYVKRTQESSVVPKELSEKEIEEIDLSIIKIRNIIKEMKNASKSERRKKANDILAEIKKIQDYQLTIEQAEQLNALFNAEELQRLKLSETDRVDFHINKYKKSTVRKLAEAVDIAQGQTEDIEELKKLERKITSNMERENPILLGAVKSRIYNKILKIQQKQVLEVYQK